MRTRSLPLALLGLSLMVSPLGCSDSTDAGDTADTAAPADAATDAEVSDDASGGLDDAGAADDALADGASGGDDAAAGGDDDGSGGDDVAQPDAIVDTSDDATDGDEDAPAAPDTADDDASGGSDEDVAGDEDGGPDEDAGPAKVCEPGETSCAGAKLATCGPQGDGFIETNCFPGLTCVDGACAPVSNNLIIAFDTSGSMTGKVSGCSGSTSWPSCSPQQGCTRMDVSKKVFSQALTGIDDQQTRMALFRFPSVVNGTKSSPSCNSGYHSGKSEISTDTDAQFVDETSSWFWDALHETLSVAFPPDASFPAKANILSWMDGTESVNNAGACGASGTCKYAQGCLGGCCSGQCYVHSDPELRATGGTPIGKTLFYIGEYIRNRVVIDGKACAADADCGNVNYACVDIDPATGQGVCEDPAASCRETLVLLFTDGGQTNQDEFFGPWVQAKRLGFGLGCWSDADCVNGAVCKDADQPNNVYGHCSRPFAVTDYYCTKTMEPCLPGSSPGDVTYCAGGQCIEDPLLDPDMTNYSAINAQDKAHDVLRAPNGVPIGVRLFVVDISENESNVKKSMQLALSGNGVLLDTKASDPAAFLGALESVFDIKTKKLCGADDDD
jgi:hypothetical protein